MSVATTSPKPACTNNPYIKANATSTTTSNSDGPIPRNGQILDSLGNNARSSVNSAIALFNKFQQARYEPALEELRSDDVVNSPGELALLDEENQGKMFQLLGNFAFWLHKNPPLKKGSLVVLSSATIAQYFGGVKAG